MATALVAALSLGGSVACSDRSPVGPMAGSAIVQPGQIVPTASVAMSGGPDLTYQIPGPSTNTVDGGRINWTNTGADFPAGSWVEIEVSGTVAVSANSACTAPECDTNANQSYIGASAPWSGLASNELGLLLRLQRPGNVTETVRRVAKSGNPDVWHVVGRLPLGGELQVYRQPVWGSYQGQGMYSLSDGRVVRARRILPPVPRPAAPVTSLPATVTMSLSWSYSPVSVYTWYFVPGDTSSAPAYPALTSSFRVCQVNVATCAYNVTQPGRFYAAMVHTNSWNAVAASDPIGGGSPPHRVGVSCSPTTLVRGETVECEVGVTPSAPFRVLSLGALTPGGWAAENWHSIDSVSGSMGAGQVYQTEGPAVRSAAIYARVEVQTSSGTEILDGETSIIVLPRSWAAFNLTQDPVIRTGIEDTAVALPQGWSSVYYVAGKDTVPENMPFGKWIPPVPGGNGPVTHALWNDLGSVAVTAGPFKGYGYSQSPITLPPSEIQISTALFEPWGDWAQMQTGGWYYAMPYCLTANVPVLREYVLRHEGAALFGANGDSVDPNSHEQMFRDALTAAQLGAQFEKISGAGYTADSVAARAQALFQPVFDAFVVESNAWDEAEQESSPIHAGFCAWRWGPDPAP